MPRGWDGSAYLLLVAALFLSSCTAATGGEEAPGRLVSAAATSRPNTTDLAVSPTQAGTTPGSLPPTPAPDGRVVSEQPWTPFATAGAVTLTHPSARVELVGFHESNHDGARQLEPLPSIIRPVMLETRERGTGTHSAADIVVDPEVEIRAPVTGTVKRAGTYVLYCDYSDDFVVIAPDAHPGWEVKLLHISGVGVRAGDRVIAGETVLAPGATQLPFESQVDELTASPSWPHVHLEVVDPTVPIRPKPGKRC